MGHEMMERYRDIPVYLCASVRNFNARRIFQVPVSSVLCLSSVRELPVQVRELYAQGFVLVAVHPFVHPCGPRHARIQRQLHRAVLLKETPPSLEKNQLKWAGHRLETDVCVAGHQALDPEVIQNYVKRIQDVSEQGVMFVGFLQQPGGGPCFLGSWDPDELSSLHSSPSPIHRQPFSSGVSPTDPADPRCGVLEPESTSFSPSKPAQNFELAGEEPSRQTPEESTDSTDIPQDRCTSETNAGGQNHVPAGALGALLGPLSAETLEKVQQLDRSPPRATKTEQERPDSDADLQNHRERLSSSPESSVGSPVLDLGGRTAESNVGFTESQSPQRVRSHNNNIHLRDKTSENEKESAMSPLTQGGTQLFALYNHTGELNISERFYSLRVPLRVQKEAGLTTEVDAHWLDHMTQHFTSGAHLIDGFFHLGDDNDNGISSVDSVFIFQSSAEEMAAVSYDAIVVEQWTVVDGVVVRTDYVPLLQSLAPYGWRLMCVLPTPIVKTNSDGSLSTKQILFLQRPTLQRKRKDFKMLNLRGRSKARKSYCGETPEKEGENASPVMESEVDELLRNTNEEEEEEEDEEKGDGKSEGASPGRGEEEAGRGEGEAAPSPQTRGRVSDGDWEEDKGTPSDRREKSARWTGGDGAVKEERIKQQQLSERALFSGVC